MIMIESTAIIRDGLLAHFFNAPRIISVSIVKLHTIRMVVNSAL